MSNLPGTNVTSTIVPFTEGDDYATHDERYGKGGYRAVADKTARNSIKPDRRNIGMAVRTTDDNILWVLTSDDGSAVLPDSAWTKESDTISMDGGEF